MKNINLDMELSVEGIGETIRVQGTSLFIGNEYDNNKTSVYLESLSEETDSKLIGILEELHKVVSEAHTEIKRLAS